MLKWSIILLVIVVLSGVLGYGGEGGSAAGIARVLFWVFAVLFVASLTIGARRLR